MPEKPTGSNFFKWINLIPCLLVFGAMVGMSFVRVDQDTWERYRGFWGGNPAEVYSHWLNVVLMSGHAMVIAWLVAAESVFRSRDFDPEIVHRNARRCLVLSLVVNGIFGFVLDSRHGEGAVWLCFPVFHLPMLSASYYLLRRIAALLKWNASATPIFSVSFAVLHVVAQIYYEPSGTGGPNEGIIPIWLGLIIFASGWLLVRNVRSGKLARLAVGTLGRVRRKRVWIPVVLVFLGITLFAHRLHQERSEAALRWMNEIEAYLTDETVARLKSEWDPSLAVHVRGDVPESATSLLNDPHTRQHTLRIFIPLDKNYLFLWGNSRFQYCDKRSLNNQFDQEFIDGLIARGGTHQTGLYSILWSPYMAGRVLQDKTGAVKALCVVNMEED